MKIVLVFIAGLLCPVAVGLVAYWLWFVRGRNTGWPA